MPDKTESSLHNWRKSRYPVEPPNTMDDPQREARGILNGIAISAVSAFALGVFVWWIL